MEPSELTTFGALFRFALRLQGDAANFFERLATGPVAGKARALAPTLTDRHGERRALLERTRSRVNETILEPISGLDAGRYLPDSDAAARTLGLPAAVAPEDGCARFDSEFAEAAESILAEAARTFQRLGEESARNADRLRAAAL